MSQYQNNTDSETGAGPWIKAAICAAAVLLLLFFVVTRSSCTRQGGDPSGSESAQATNQETPRNGSETEDQESESATDSNSTSEEKATEEEKSSESPEETPETANPTTETEDSLTEDSSGPTSAGGGASGASAETDGQSIGGLFVKGEKLGVILDVSGSMTRYLESLRAEIGSRFDSPVFLEVEGCFIEPSLFDPAKVGQANPGNPYRRDSVMNAIRELVEIEQVDSVYWFCDLQDERTEEGLRELEQIVRGRSGKSPGFHLYIRSTDEKPDEILDRIIRLSGGSFEKRR